MAKPTEIRDTFFLECEELLEALTDGLHELGDGMETGAPEPETINAVFRAVHSIKGGGAAFELDHLVEFAHVFETALDQVRTGVLGIDSAIHRLFLRATDHLTDLVTAARNEQDIERAPTDILLAELDHLLGPRTPETSGDDIDFAPLTIDLGLDPAPETLPATRYNIRFVPDDTLYANGNDPAHLLRALSDLGEVESRLQHDSIPLFDDFSPTRSYVFWDIQLITTEPEMAIHDVFEFAQGDCSLKIEPETPAPESALQPLPTLSPVGDIPSDAPAGKSAPITEVAGAGKLATLSRSTVRVELGRIDRLINVVGELVINQARLAQCAADEGLSAGNDFAIGLDEFKQLSCDIQESVMAIRAQPVKSLFQRVARTVRDVSETTGKSVRLVTEGEATEIDKTLIEKLADPLTHMVRNAVDHGIETLDRRRAAGKPETGTVTLSASHSSGRVVIRISDDGAGIDQDKVRQIAVAKGLISADLDLSEAEANNLLFLPGFSTSPSVSTVSGRGVGMDVVKCAIQSLNGRVSVSSTAGQGTAVLISLPLTLAVLEGIIVEVSGQKMVIPLTAVHETLRPSKTEIFDVGESGRAVRIRGEFLPVVDLGLGVRVSELRRRHASECPAADGDRERTQICPGRRCNPRPAAVRDQGS